MGFNWRLIADAKQCTAVVTRRPFPATTGGAGGFYGVVGVSRVQRCHRLVAGWPESSPALSWAEVALGHMREVVLRGTPS